MCLLVSLFSILVTLIAVNPSSTPDDINAEKGMFLPLENVKILSSSLPLFSNIEEYNLLDDTKTIRNASRSEDCLLALSSLLDKEKTESTRFKQYIIEATPFKEEFCFGYVSLSTQSNKNPVVDSLTCAKVFYVYTLDTETDTTDLMVVTMIPEYSYLSRHKETELSYLYKPNYSGIILYSDIDGTYLESIYYRRGQLFPAWPLEIGESIQEDAKVHYLITYQKNETKGENRQSLYPTLKVALLEGEYL